MAIVPGGSAKKCDLSVGKPNFAQPAQQEGFNSTAISRPLQFPVTLSKRRSASLRHNSASGTRLFTISLRGRPNHA